MTPLERAARAVRDEIAIPHGDGTFVVEGGFRDDDFFQDVALAVIAAIREPDEAMRKAGLDTCWGDGSVLDGYEAMIDALLGETGNPAASHDTRAP